MVVIVVMVVIVLMVDETLGSWLVYFSVFDRLPYIKSSLGTNSDNPDPFRFFKFEYGSETR